MPRTSNNIVSLAFLASITAGLAAPHASAQAGPPYITGYRGCMQVPNITGQTANDFHIEILNFPPLLVTGMYAGTGGYTGNWTPINNGTGVRINYFGGSTPPGGVEPFGFRTQAHPPLGQETTASAYWTLDGVEIGERMPVPNFHWATSSNHGNGSNGGGVIDLGHYHIVDDAFQVQRRVNSVSYDIDIASLLADPSVFENATLIDPEPTVWFPGEVLNHQFEIPDESPAQTLVMIYSVFNMSDELVGTFYEAAQVTTIAPCAADIAEPFGILDLGDVSSFVSGFLSMAPIADVNNDGLWDLGDVGQFVNSFITGCP